MLERENAIGTGISSRNSEVIHAGLYYPHGSLKARLCVERPASCSTHSVNRTAWRIGAAASWSSRRRRSSWPASRKLAERARANGVHDLQC